MTIAGKNSARDRDGNLGSESKLIADELAVLTDAHLQSYESTGGKIAAPKVSAKVKQEKRAAYTAKRQGVQPAKASTVSEAKPVYSGQPPQPEDVPSRLFVHVKNPEDHDALVSLKAVCSKHPGITDVVLVLGEADKSAIKLPFRVDAGDGLLEALNEILGEECIALK